MSHDDRYPEARDNATPEPSPRAPRWPVVVGTAVAIVLLVFIAGLHLTGVVGPK